ncbi:Gfo/Idh/MocA family protein [Dyadobacter tibetensis]|uniref:Gfo/Idh/MocA family protein n=1 Tax=Dyadobacter tibetensis TaxID=1211851 RepID=UPI00046E9C5C|nr:Gfo/Idh/MocA family oxidoreductase [Dyadobacter tibetensis]
MNKLKGVVIGAGYFSDFHYDAWSRMPEVEILALADTNCQNARLMQEKYKIEAVYEDYLHMVMEIKPDFVDIVTPPATHLDIVSELAGMGIPMICQKPLAPSLEEAKQLVGLVESTAVPFMVHENFRFQPWHQEIQKLVAEGTIGEIHNINFHSRMGDGWGPDAYLSRQPYFREYDRLLIYETGIHFIDLIRFYGGEIVAGMAKIRRLNPAIRGEDRVLMHFETERGIWAQWDANRYNEPDTSNSRYTFCRMEIEGYQGTIGLDYQGNITIQKLGQLKEQHSYSPSNQGFAGDSCLATQRHFIQGLSGGAKFETNGLFYLENLKIQELAYQSAIEGQPFKV